VETRGDLESEKVHIKKSLKRLNTGAIVTVTRESHRRKNEVPGQSLTRGENAEAKEGR